mmetsp:Transcript_42820/g.137034  ORF Transcript_42820/g.137034 Transcript_42820/m.137034 type:complete len:269 (+) Transcript_42820:58-864(+)
MRLPLLSSRTRRGLWVRCSRALYSRQNYKSTPSFPCCLFSHQPTLTERILTHQRCRPLHHLDGVSYWFLGPKHANPPLRITHPSSQPRDLHVAHANVPVDAVEPRHHDGHHTIVVWAHLLLVVNLVVEALGLDDLAQHEVLVGEAGDARLQGGDAVVRLLLVLLQVVQVRLLALPGLLRGHAVAQQALEALALLLVLHVVVLHGGDLLGGGVALARALDIAPLLGLGNVRLLRVRLAALSTRRALALPHGLIARHGAAALHGPVRGSG